MRNNRALDKPTVVFVQFTNPGAYPPIEHAAELFSKAGWSVRLLGVSVKGVDALRMAEPLHQRTLLFGRPRSGLLGKLHYLAFLGFAVAMALRWRADCLYVSDALVSPVGLLLAIIRPRVLIVYHEHDSPERPASGRLFSSLVYWARNRLARRADLVVAPNRHRGVALLAENGIASDRLFVAFNCPSLAEIRSAPVPRLPIGASAPLWILYHGSIVPDRLPPAVVEALALLPREFCLRVIGYEPAGARGYVDALKAHSQVLGLGDRIEFVGTVPSRSDLLGFADVSHVGLALMPMAPGDINMEHMTGASNKAFDYLARGLPLIVSDRPDWVSMFVNQGVAQACDPRSPKSIAAAVNHFLRSPDQHYQSAQTGIGLIRDQWNYEHQFAPVLTHLEALLHQKSASR